MRINTGGMACNNIDGRGTPCPRPYIASPEEYSFIPRDFADYIMLMDEHIRVVGSPPYPLNHRVRRGLIMYQRVRNGILSRRATMRKNKGQWTSV